MQMWDDIFHIIPMVLLDKHVLYAKLPAIFHPSRNPMIALDQHPSGRHFLQIPGPSPVDRKSVV